MSINFTICSLWYSCIWLLLLMNSIWDCAKGWLMTCFSFWAIPALRLNSPCKWECSWVHSELSVRTSFRMPWRKLSRPFRFWRVSIGTNSHSSPSCCPKRRFSPIPAPFLCLLKLLFRPSHLQPGKLHEQVSIFFLKLRIIALSFWIELLALSAAHIMLADSTL